MRISFGLIIFGASLMWFSIRAWLADSSSSADPIQLTCAELADGELNSNRHVVVTALALSSGYVTGTKGNEVWRRALPATRFAVLLLLGAALVVWAVVRLGGSVGRRSASVEGERAPRV